VEASLIHVDVRGEPVIPDANAEVMVEHLRRSGPQVGPVAVDACPRSARRLGGLGPPVPRRFRRSFSADSMAFVSKLAVLIPMPGLPLDPTIGDCTAQRLNYSPYGEGNRQNL